MDYIEKIELKNITETIRPTLLGPSPQGLVGKHEVRHPEIDLSPASEPYVPTSAAQ